MTNSVRKKTQAIKHKNDLLAKSEKIDTAVNLIENVTIISIFSVFLNDYLLELMELYGRFFIFPLTAVLGLARAGIAIFQAAFAGTRAGIVRAIVETVSALAMTAAVAIGFFAASVSVAIVAPIIFTAVLGAKTLFHIAAMFYYGMYKRSTTEDETKRHDYLKLTINNGIAATFLAVATVTIGLVMLAAIKLVAIVGIVANLVGMGMLVYKSWATPNTRVDEPDQPLDNSLDKSSTPWKTAKPSLGNTRLHQALGVKRPASKDHETSNPDVTVKKMRRSSWEFYDLAFEHQGSGLREARENGLRRRR